MKIRLNAPFEFCKVGATGITFIQVPPGVYSVEVREHPTDKKQPNWYILTRPEEVDSKFRNTTIGATMEYVNLHHLRII